MEANRLVALRYARVFVLEPKAVLTYFRNELTLVTLSEPAEVQVYRLDDEGRIVSETKTLKAGTKVFANRAGYAVLEYGTGNPLTAELPAADKPMPKSNKPLTEANNAAKPGQAESPPKPTSPTQTAANGVKSPLDTPAPSPSPNATLVPNTPGSTVTATDPATGAVVEPKTAVAGVQMSTGGSSIANWVLPVGLAGAVAALAGGGGGGTHPTNGGGGGGGDTNPPIVPEPTSFMALGTGLIALGGFAMRKRKS